MQLLVIGYATLDIYPNAKIPGGAGGGMSLNAATLKDVEPYLLAPLGQDKNGQFYKRELEKAGVNTSLCLKSSQNPTCIIHNPFGKSFERVWSDNGAATAFDNFDPTTIPFSNFEGIILANAGPNLIKKLTPHFPSSTPLFYIPGPHIVHNPNMLVTEVLAKSTIVFANAEEAPVITPVKPIKLGTKILITTHGSSGVKVATQSGSKSYSAPIIKNPIDATGAGDCFSLGFIVEYLKSKNLDQSVQAGQKLAKKIIMKQGVLLND